MRKTPYDAEEREKIILETIKIDGKVRVVDLVKKCGVSGVTIRHDLERLEKLQYLERVHGGAIQLSKQYDNMDFYERMSLNKVEKINIGKEVEKLIKDGDTIAINSGTTSYLVALELVNKKNIKVITNSISIATELSNYNSINVLLLGGSINSHYLFTFGTDTLIQMAKYKMDKAIISVDGVNDNGITTYHQEEVEVSKKMMEQSKVKVVIADYSKIGRESFVQINSMNVVDRLITNEKADGHLLRELRRKGIDVICSK